MGVGMGIVVIVGVVCDIIFFIIVGKMMCGLGVGKVGVIFGCVVGLIIGVVGSVFVLGSVLRMGMVLVLISGLVICGFGVVVMVGVISLCSLVRSVFVF